MEKALLSLKEVCEYTGWKETKVRELLKRETSTFTITNAGNMVLCDVQWSNAESRGYGACKNYTVHLEPFSNTL